MKVTDVNVKLKTLVMGETNCEFQVLKIDKIVRPVVIAPIEIV